MAVIRDDDEERRVRVEERVEQLQRHAEEQRCIDAETALRTRKHRRTGDPVSQRKHSS